MANVTNVDVDRIKSRARTLGITLKHLNQSIGKYDNFLSCVRIGTDRIDEEELAVIAHKINTTVAYLVGKTDDPEPPKAPEDIPDKNAIRLIGRDGETIERQLTDEQMQILRALISQLPEAPTDI